MANAKQVVVETNVLPVNQFVAMLGEFSADITKSAEMLVSVELFEGNIKDTKAGLSSTLWGVLVSQGEPVTLGWYDAIRLHWREAYNVARGGKLEDVAMRKAWSRAFGLVTEDYGLTIPVAETKGAEAKAGKRAEEAEKVAALIASAPVAELQDRAKALFNKAGDGGKAGKEALAEAKLVTKAIDKATSAEADRLKAQVKEVKESIRDLLKHTDDFYVLAEVQELLLGSVNDTEALL